MWMAYLTLALQVSSLSIIILYDSSSKESLIHSLNYKLKLISEETAFDEIVYESYCLTELSDLEYTIESSQLDILIDLTSSLLYYEFISLKAQSLGLIHLHTRDHASTKLREASFLASSQEADLALIKVLEYYGCRDIVIISSEDSYSIKLLNLILSHTHLNIKENLILPSSMEYVGVKESVAREVKYSGVRNILVIANGIVTEKVLRACEEAKMFKSGFVYLLGPRSYLFEPSQDYEIFKNGVLYLSEKLENRPSSVEELIIEGMGKILREVFSICSEQVQRCNKYNLIDQIRSLSEDFKSLQLKNIQNGESVVVGQFIEGELSMLKYTSYAGDTLEFPSNSPNTITISIPSETAGNDNARQSLFLTAKLAISHINKSPSIIPNFVLISQDFGYGTQAFNQTIAEQSILPNLDKFESAFLTGPYSAPLIAFMNFMSDLGLYKAYVGSVNTAVSLSSEKDFPNFVRTVPSDSYMPVMYVQMIQFYGWKNIGVIYSDEVWGKGIYNSLLKETDSKGIRIVNQEEYRNVPSFPNSDNLNRYWVVAQKLVESKSRVVVLVVYYEVLNIILANLYDLGMRRGDLVIIAIEWLTLDLVNYDDPSIDYKLRELLRGTIQFFPVTFVGDIGQKVKDDLNKEYSRIANYQCCFYYDSVWLIGHALDWLLKSGKDYENPQILIDTTREIRFTGCTGLVSISDNSNDRNRMGYDIMNLQFNQATNTWSIERVGKYDPTSTQVLEIYQNIQWPDGTSNIPSDLRPDEGFCLYKQSELEELDYKNYILLAVCLSVFVVSFGTTGYIWKRWWNFNIPTLNEVVEMNMQDMIAIFMMAINSLQYIALGPDISKVSPLLQELTKFSNIDMITLLAYDASVIHVILCTVIGVCLAWICCVVLHLCENNSCIGNFRIMKYIILLKARVIPLIGNSGFQPILSIFLTIFVCDLVKGKDSVFDKSVLNIDCTQYCWSDIHIVYSVINTVLLLSFTGLVVYYKPLWQSDRSAELHIIQTPYIMLLETLLQVYFVVLDKLIKRSYKLAHAILFLTPLTIYLIFTLIKDAYNYKRAGLWQQMCLLGVIWIAIISTLESNIENKILLSWYALLLIGWSIIVIAGIILMCKKYPSYLTISTRNFSELFLFQLRNSRAGGSFDNKITPITYSNIPMNPDNPVKEMNSSKKYYSEHNKDRFDYYDQIIQGKIVNSKYSLKS